MNTKENPIINHYHYHYHYLNNVKPLENNLILNTNRNRNNFISQHHVPPLLMCESDEQGIVRLKPVFDAKQEQINEKLIKELEHNYIRQIIVKPIIKVTKNPMTQDHVNYRRIMIEQIANKFKIELWSFLIHRPLTLFQAFEYGGTIHYTHVCLYVYKRALKSIYMWFNCIEHL